MKVQTDRDSTSAPRARFRRALAPGIRIAEEPDWTYASLRDALGISTSTAHNSVHRLQEAGLLLPDGKSVNRSALLEFIEHGVRYAFPAAIDRRKVRGIATAYAAPALSDEVAAGESAVVWPHPQGERRIASVKLRERLGRAA